MNMMKKTSIYYFSLAAILAGSFISCLDDDQGHSIEEIKASAYAKRFIQDIGEPAPNHDWGFKDLPVVDMTSTRAVNTNSNEWHAKFMLNVPGYPDHLHDHFLGEKTTSYTSKTVPANADQNWFSNEVGNPLGDVTEEEIAYVMNYFKTTQFPKGQAIHWEDFFVQFVGYNGSNRIKAGEMDQLGYQAIDGTWEHVNDFNGKTKTLKYVSSAGTEAWSYRASHSDTYQDNKYVIVHLVFDIPQTDCPYHCTSHHYDGWYVAFDYESKKGDSGDVPADGYFDDWVVKVTPGTHQGWPVTVRVMCEDLGNSFDWDFNDVVFDVTFEGKGSNIYAKLTLRASGGTLPIIVGTTDERYETHRLLGDGSMTPILSSAAPAVYTVKVPSATNNGKNVANAKKIPIYVDGVEVTAIDLSQSNTPQRFACPDYVQWSPELTNICVTYPNFPTWVQDPDFTDVEKLWQYNPHQSGNTEVVITH